MIECLRRLHFPHWLALAVCLIAVGSAPVRALADDAATEAEEERLEALQRHTERGWQAFRSGNHDEVLARMDRVEKYDPESPLPALLRARVAMRRGAYEEALKGAEAAQATHPDQRGLEGVRFSALLALGRVEDVESEARKALVRDPQDGMAYTALGLAEQERGHREEAMQAYEGAIGTFRRDASPAEDLPWIARAAIQATWLSPNPSDDLLGDAGKLLSRYLDAHPEDQDVLLLLADLFQSQSSPKGQATASKYYQRILKANPEIAEARVGLARKLLIFYQQDRAMQELQRALATNPNLVAALSLLASIHVGNGDYEKADDLLGRALAVNPHDKDALAVNAARLWITGEKDAYAAVEKRVLERDPTYGRFYLVISDLVGERQRRYDIAATLAERAIETDANDAMGYTVLGEALMNLGRTEEARRAFDTAVDKSKRYKNVKRDNWLSVLEILDDFRTVTSDNFVVRVHPSEVEVMTHYLPKLLEDSWATLSEKYGFTPESPVRVDAFHRADDFSVRSVGVAGLPALGVCFGGVITLLGPTSRPVGSFSWARTAWHEFAHVVTLQLSEGQVPRWLTEGLSVYEEKMRRTNWSREMERQLFDRYHNDRLLRMATINRAFRGPDIGFAYYQGGLIAEHLTRTRGFGVIPKMLKEYAKDQTTAEVFEEVLSLELADYDRTFREFVDSVVGDYKMVPRWDDKSLAAFEARTKSNPQDGEAWTRLGWAHLQRKRAIDAGNALRKAQALRPDDPETILLEGRLAQVNRRTDLALSAYERFLATGADDLETRLFLADRLIKSGEDVAQAMAHLEAAKTCFPFVVGKQSPYRILATLYQGAGDTAKALAELEAYAEIVGEDYGVRRDLLAAYSARGDHEAVSRVCEEMVDINPFGAKQGDAPDLDLHKDWAAALLALGRKEEAVRELEVQVALLGMLDESDRIKAGAVATHVGLGELHLEAGRALDALEQATAALRLSPEDVAARMLKGRAEEAAGYR